MTAFFRPVTSTEVCDIIAKLKNTATNINEIPVRLFEKIRNQLSVAIVKLKKHIYFSYGVSAVPKERKNNTGSPRYISGMGSLVRWHILRTCYKSNSRVTIFRIFELCRIRFSVSLSRENESIEGIRHYLI